MLVKRRTFTQVDLPKPEGVEVVVQAHKAHMDLQVWDSLWSSPLRTIHGKLLEGKGTFGQVLSRRWMPRPNNSATVFQAVIRMDQGLFDKHRITCSEHGILFSFEA